MSQLSARMGHAGHWLAQRRRAIPQAWVTRFSIALSLVLVVAVVRQFVTLDWHASLALMPRSALFWLAFAAFYLAGPSGDWIIFRRLWHLPPRGFFALLRKMIYNELVLGYAGETWFYAWARRQKGLPQDPFGAVKDVAILSALAGNLVTLLLVAALWPQVHSTIVGQGTRALVLALAPVVLISLGILAFRDKVFSLGKREMIFVAGVHLLRILGKNTLLAVLWHWALPEVPLVWWLYLSAVRLLVLRLPLVANKEAIFAGLAIVLLGRDLELVSLMAMTAAAVVLANLAVAIGFIAADLAARRARPQPG